MYSRHILYKEEINYHSFSNLLEFIDFLNFRCLILFLGVSLVYLSCITVVPPPAPPFFFALLFYQGGKKKNLTKPDLLYDFLLLSTHSIKLQIYLYICVYIY